MFAIDSDTVNDPRFGRIATFTWPEMSHKDLEHVRKAASIRTAYPRTGAEAAFNLAVREFDGSVSDGLKLFVRIIGPRTAEFISEVVVPQGATDFVGQRENLVRVKLATNVSTGLNELAFDAYKEEGLPFINKLGETIQARYKHHLTHVQSGLVSDWAERVSLKEFGALQLSNRGHSVHVRGPGVARFDLFVTTMIEVSRGEEQVQLFKTLDTDPASMASLLSSVAARVNDAIAVGEKRAAAAKTARGINSIVDGLVATRAQIEAYRDLLGAGLDQFVAALDKASGALSTAEVVQEFGGLPA